jgi:hypothetical protein
MAKSGNSKDKLKLKIVWEELNKFERLIEGHKKLLAQIGRL